MTLAPVAIFVYKRPWHTIQMLQSLFRNKLARVSEIYIFSDSAKKESDSKLVYEVRRCLRDWKTLPNVMIVENEKNWGLSGSVINGVTKIFEKFDRVIVIEDDLVLSEFFLEYMNEALEYYQDCERVISIHGYIYPLKSKLPETFFLRGADCWGWATWRRGWNLFESDPQKLQNEIYKNKIETEFDLNGTVNNMKMLKKQVKGEIDSWAIRWHASAFLKNKYTLYPGRSLIQNIGMGKHSTHTKRTNVYDVELSSTPISVEKIQVKENEFVKKEIEKYFKSIKMNYLQKLIFLLKDRFNR